MSKLLLFCLILLTACGVSHAPAAVTLLPTATTLRVVQTTAVPTVQRDLLQVSTQSSSPALQPVPCEPTPLTRPAHVVTATLDYAVRQVDVQQQITVPNLSVSTYEQLVLDVEPNRFPGVFELATIRMEGELLPSFELTDRRLVLPLAAPLLPGCAARVELQFRLSLPPVQPGWDGRDGYLGYTARQINLGRWLALVAFRQNGDWVVHQSTLIGEQSVAEIADWEVTIRLLNAPESTLVAAPGDESRPTADAQRFRLSAARDFAVSISDQFSKRSSVAANGVTVELYTLADVPDSEQGIANAGDHALDIAVRSQDLFSELFGQYPWDRLVVVQGDFADGMEFSGLIFVGDSWFVNWTGTVQSYLTIITMHEVSHQWWYARVGSDQALTPWLDEALATYSEYLFYEDQYPDLRDWWWQFRVATFVPDGFTDIAPVGSAVYQFDNVRSYINAVYLRGARMFHELRTDLGSTEFFEWLRQYVDAGRDRVVTPDLLLSFLTPAQRAATAETRARYLGIP